MSEIIKYWEKTWNLPLADKAETIDGTTGYGQQQSYELMSEIYNLIDKNPDKAYEIAKHAMQTKGLLFYPHDDSEMSSYPIIICKAASCDKKVVNLILERMEEKGFSHSVMFRSNYGWGEFNEPAIYYDILQKQLNEGDLDPTRMFEALRRGSRYACDEQYEKCLNSDYKPEPSIRSGTVGESLAGEGENELHRAMADCVIKDPKLWDKYYAHVNATMKMNVFVGEIGDLIKCCNAVSSNNTNLPRSFCNDVVDIASKVNWDYREKLKPVLEHIAIEDLSYFYKNRDLYDSKFTQQVAIKDHSIIPSLKGISRENFDAFAQIYEEYAATTSEYSEKDFLGRKNIALDDKEAQKIMNSIKDKISEADHYGHTPKLTQVWLVKNAQKYPNLVSEILKEKELPYVEMCIKNIEKPEKENIASLLNRLETKEDNAYRDFYENRPEGSEQKFDSKKYQESLTFEDFQDARDFVARRDICMQACRSFVKEGNEELHEQYPETEGDYPVLDSKPLSYDMAEVGIADFKTAKRVAKLFYELNGRPDTYGSAPYNQYYPKDLLPIAKSNVMQDWMYPVMMDAIEKGGLTMSEGRIPSERTLFDCCKAWKINPAMPQKLAKFVGTHSLRGRILAGAIFDKMCEDGKTTPQEWHDNKVLHEKFYEELARAEKMPMEKSFKQYIPNTSVNRKRMVGIGMEEKGIENTPENFKAIYKKVREEGFFEKVLAKPEEARTTISSRLLVEVARRKKQNA